MDRLREYYDAPFGDSLWDRTVLDRLANLIGDMLVRGTRANAWDDAMDVWRSADRAKARAQMLGRLDVAASFLGRALLLPIL